MEWIHTYQMFYDLLWFFCIYAVLGWCTEVIYAAVTKGVFINRGFLNGPVCPIYGFGVVLVVALLEPFKEKRILLFFAAMIVTSLLELITGFILEKVFHERWWDYSDKPFNIGGYICLAFSIVWGLACMAVVEIVHPIIETLVHHLDNPVGAVILAVVLIAFAADLIVTLCNLIHLKRQLRVFTAVTDELHHISDRMGKNIFENVEKSRKRNEKIMEFAAEKKEELTDSTEVLKEKKESLVAQGKMLMEKYSKSLFLKRLYRAYPRLQQAIFKEELPEGKEEQK